MAGALEWILKLTDRFSGPANAAANSVANLNSKMRAAQTSVAHVDTQHKHAAFRWNKGVKEMAASQKQFAKTTEGSSSGIVGAFGGYEAAALGAATAILAVEAAIAGVIIKGAQLAIDASSFRENSIAAFENILKSHAAAVDLFDKADALAGKLGLEDEAVIGQLKRLTKVGFEAAQALAIVKSAADLAAVGSPEDAAAFTTLIATMEAKGKFDSRSLNQLAKLGIKTEDIYTALAKKLGKTNAEVAALIKAGKIDTAEAIEAITKVVDEKFGGAAEKVANSVPRLLFRIKDAIGDLFNKVDLTALRDALASVVAVLDGPIGARIKAAITSIFGNLFDALFGAFGDAEVEAIFGAIADALEGIAAVVKIMAPIVREVIGGMIEGFTAVWPLIKLAGSAFLGLVNILASIPIGVWKIFGYALLIIVGALIAIVTALAAVAFALVALVSLPFIVFGTFLSILGDVWDAITGFASSMYEAGAGMISGLVDGIMAGAASVVSAIVGVATSAIDAAKSALGIASPSKVFGEMGAFTSQGFGEGIANDNSGADAMSAMVEPPSAASAKAGGKAAGRASGGGGGGSVTIHNLVVQSATGSPEDTAAAIAEAFERMRFAVGA